MTPLHPSIVHFPIVLLAAAAVLYAVALRTRKQILEITAFGFHVGGLLFCILGIFTGDYESDRIVADDVISAMMARHENMVMLCTYGFGILGLWAFLRQKSIFKLERIGFVVIFVTLNVVLAFGAHIGGQMVYQHGAGVTKMPSSILPENHPPTEVNDLNTIGK